MFINPILNKELTLGSRTIKLPIAICIYNIVLAAIALTVLFSISSSTRAIDYESLMMLFPLLATMQCFIILLMIPVITASSIAGERERQTLDVILTAPISPMRIVLGKIMSAICQVMMFVISSIPIMSLAFILGGMNWFKLLGFIGMVIFASFYVGAIGVFCSSKTKKTVTSVILSFVIIFAVMGVTLFIFALKMAAVTRSYYTPSYAGGQAVPQVIAVTSAVIWPLINPAVTVGNYVFQAFTGVGIADIGDRVKGNIDGVSFFIIQHWNTIGVIVNTLIAFIFISLAAKEIDPMRKKRIKRGKKKQTEEE